MLAPFSNYPVNQAFERLMAEERAARAARAPLSLTQRITQILLGASWHAPRAA